jgi:CRISPR-associated protein Cmr2
MYQVRDLTNKLYLPPDIPFGPDFQKLPASSWIGLEIRFTLATPWYSKDDRPFHVLDNPVRKDRVFGVPFMAAASWKGLLRWAYGMNSGLIGSRLESDQGKTARAKKEIVHLFGNERDERESFHSGSLICYPTWFNALGFQVINPHDRSRRAGTQPIYYEVVPAKTPGVLRLLYAPSPGEAGRDGALSVETLSRLIDAIEVLLMTYGISAKRTVGWGTASINGWTGYWKGAQSFTSPNAEGFKKELAMRRGSRGGAR